MVLFSPTNSLVLRNTYYAQTYASIGLLISQQMTVAGEATPTSAPQTRQHSPQES